MYVVDLARALAQRDEVEQVDLVTRRVEDPAVASDYAEPIEPLSGKARILRIVAGNREDIGDLDEGPRSVITELLVTVDTYDLYGRVAMPKHHRQEEVPEIYRLVADSEDVFVNPALTAPFGLTLLEAAASGLPLVATENGGPVDIIGNCNNGILVDSLDKAAIADGLLALLTDSKRYCRMRTGGDRPLRLLRQLRDPSAAVMMGGDAAFAYIFQRFIRHSRVARSSRRSDR